MIRKKLIIKKLIIIIVILMGFLIINSLDKTIRFQIKLLDYYRYNAQLTEREKELIREKDFLVGVYNYPPLIYTNEFGSYNTGIVADYLSQLAIELGGNIHLKRWTKNQDIHSRNSEIDIFVMEKDTNKVLDEMIITQPLCVVKTKVLVNKGSGIESIKDLSGKVLVTLQRDKEESHIIDYFNNIKDVKIVEVDNMYQGFALINNKVASGFIGDDMEAAHFINVTSKSSNYKFLKPTIHAKEIVLAVKNDNIELLNVLNKGILQLKKKNLISQTQKKWLGDFETDSIDIRNIELAYRVLIIIILIIIGFSFWNYIITQRVNTKTRELSESKEELRLIIDNIQSGIMVIGNDSIILECNDSIAKIVGITKENLIGSNYKDVKKLEPFVNVKNMNMVLNIKNDYYYVTSQKITPSKGMIVIENYTEKHLREKRESHESKMVAVGKLSAGLAHEIRNPLGLIKSYSYIIQKHPLNEIGRHAVTVINDSVKRINQLIENLLRFSRLSNVEMRYVNIIDLVSSIIETEKFRIQQGRIAIKSSFSGENINNILINEEVLRMVLINLVNNSIESFEKLQKQEKNIDINVISKDKKLNIKVTDNGCGIEKSKLDSIFDPFYSLKENGTGLGLYIISTEVSNNGGIIAVDSELNEGTTFEIVLPIME
ncbi:MAG: ATP-binding protein [Tissierellaceae bacterium]